MAVVTPTPKMQFLTASGAPLVGGRLYTYVAGTTTPQATFTDETGSTANTNPIILDSRGEANVWLGAASYKFRLADANDVEIWTVDYITAPTTSLSPVLSGNVTISTNSSGPALKITQTGTGPVLLVQDSADPDVTPFIINSNGLVGLGTVSPVEALDIADNGKIQLSAAGVPRTIISATSVDSVTDVSDNRNFVVRTNNNTRMTISGAGATTFGGAVTVSSGGATITAGGLTVSAGGAAITGNSTITGTLGVSNALTVSSGGAGITGNSTVTGTFGVTGTLTAQTGLTVSAGGAGIAGGLTVSSGGLTVSASGAAITGNSTVTGTLGVTSTLTAQNGLTVSSGGAGITGNSTITGTLTATSTLTAQNGLTVSAGGAGITGTLTANSGVSVPSGGVSVTGTVTATTFSGAWANIPAGTVMLFVQTSAPTGWTKSTAHNDKALRVVSGSASSGGSVAFTTAFASQAVTGTVASYTLTTADIPSHSHSATSTDSGHTHNYDKAGSNNGSYQAAAVSPNAVGSLTQTATATTSGTANITTTIGNTGGGGGHSHGFSAPNINLAVQYVDVIIATKD
jgi:hypothetical protein